MASFLKLAENSRFGKLKFIKLKYYLLYWLRYLLKYLWVGTNFFIKLYQNIACFLFISDYVSPELNSGLPLGIRGVYPLRYHCYRL